MNGATSRPWNDDALLLRVRELLADGGVDEANDVVNAALTSAPTNPAAWYMRGVIDNRRGDHRAAVRALLEAIHIDPEAGLSWLALGNALARLDDIAGAAGAYREVVSREPGWADARYNLGIVLSRQDDLDGAARAFHAAWSLDPMMFDAAKRCMATIAACVARADAPLAIPPSRDEVASDYRFTIGVCSIDEAKLERTLALYRHSFARTRHELVAVRNPSSLAKAYNEIARRSEADIVVLSHDDVDLLSEDFALRLARAFDSFDAVGVVGATRLSGPAIGWSGHPNLRGWIIHHAPEGNDWCADALSPSASAGNIVALDGVFLAARRRVFADVPFDASTFDGFHLYDIDWSYRASQRGYRLGVAGDLLLVHASRGKYGSEWDRYAERFCAKHALAPSAPLPSQFFGATFATPRDAANSLLYLSALGRETRGTSGLTAPAA